MVRAAGYGIPGFRVDGNDLLACYMVTKRAREMALANNQPVLIEAITYRVGHHSTSDDSSTYRTREEVEEWSKEGMEPVSRFRKYLQSKGWWYDNDEEEKKIKDQIRQSVIEAMLKAEKEPKPPISNLFDDVYHKLPRSLKEQKAELRQLLTDYRKDFPDLDKHLPWRDD